MNYCVSLLIKKYCILYCKKFNSQSERFFYFKKCKKDIYISHKSIIFHELLIDFTKVSAQMVRSKNSVSGKLNSIISLNIDKF